MPSQEWNQLRKLLCARKFKILEKKWRPKDKWLRRWCKCYRQSEKKRIRGEAVRWYRNFSAINSQDKRLWPRPTPVDFSDPKSQLTGKRTLRMIENGTKSPQSQNSLNREETSARINTCQELSIVDWEWVTHSQISCLHIIMSLSPLSNHPTLMWTIPTGSLTLRKSHSTKLIRATITRWIQSKNIVRKCTSLDVSHQNQEEPSKTVHDEKYLTYW